MWAGVQVYAIAGYAEGKKAAHEFGVRKRGGYFDDAGVAERADAVLDGAFAKLFVIQLARSIDGQTFVEVLCLLHASDGPCTGRALRLRCAAVVWCNKQDCCNRS